MPMRCANNSCSPSDSNHQIMSCDNIQIDLRARCLVRDGVIQNILRWCNIANSIQKSACVGPPAHRQIRTIRSWLESTLTYAKIRLCFRNELTSVLAYQSTKRLPHELEMSVEQDSFVHDRMHVTVYTLLQVMTTLSIYIDKSQIVCTCCDIHHIIFYYIISLTLCCIHCETHM